MGHVSGSIGGISAAHYNKRLVEHGIGDPAVQFQSAATLRHWSVARSKLRIGAASVARIACVGDSKTVGAGAGALFTAGAFEASRPQRIAALLAASGLAVRTNGWFRSAGLATVADVLAYDPRRSEFFGWTGGSVSLGGPALSTGNANPGSFTPTSSVDRVSIFFRNGSDRRSFTVAKGAESVTITPSGTAAMTRAEISFMVKDASPIVVTRTAGSTNLQLIGMMAWDGAVLGVEVANFGAYGITSAYHADASTAYAPCNALGVYAPDLTLINLGTNDLGNGTVTLGSYLSSLQAIVAQAKASGDCIIEWPSIGGVSPAFGSDATRRDWRDAAHDLAASNGCLFVDEEALLGGRALGATSGAFADAVQETTSAYEMEAAVLAAALT